MNSSKYFVSIVFFMQMLLQLVLTPDLSYTCCGLLLQVVSSFLLGEITSLPTTVIQELVKKVGDLSSGKLNHNLIVGKFSFRVIIIMTTFFTLSLCSSY